MLTSQKYGLNGSAATVPHSADSSQPAFRPVRIQTGKNGPEVASARELYENLGFDASQWSRWNKKNIVENPYAQQGVDWEGFDIMSNGNLTKDYALAIDFAKRLCMLARTYQGEAIRRYFIQCERELLEGKNSQTVTGLIELINQLTQQVIKLERKVDKLSKRQDRESIASGERTVPVRAHMRTYRRATFEDRKLREEAFSLYCQFLTRSTGRYYGWENLWKSMVSIYNIDLTKMERHEGEHLMDVALRNGCIRQLHNIVVTRYWA